MPFTPEETAQPRMLAPTQIEAHVTRLTAVREGLRKFEADDGRAVEVGRILEAAISVLESDSYPTNPPEIVVVEEDNTPETIAQVQKRERAQWAQDEEKAVVGAVSEVDPDPAAHAITSEEPESGDNRTPSDDGSVAEGNSVIDPPSPNEAAAGDPDAQDQSARKPSTGFGSIQGSPS